MFFVGRGSPTRWLHDVGQVAEQLSATAILLTDARLTLEA